jgi:hypothetical protein
MNLFRRVLAGLTGVRAPVVEDDINEPVNIDEMTPEELIRAGENVMACREAINMLLGIVADHRADGHECLPYCISGRLHDALVQLNEYQVRMVLTVMLKDVYDAYAQQHSQQHEA